MGKQIFLSVRNGGYGGNLYNTIPAIPGCHLMFVGPLACGRHGTAAAAEYQRLGRVSYLFTGMEDEAAGSHEKRIVDAAKQIVQSEQVRCLTVLMCCQNAVIGTDYDGLASSLEHRLKLPVRIMEVNRLHMHGKRKKPMMKRSQQELIFSFLEKRSPDAAPAVNLLGSCLAPAGHNDLIPYLDRGGIGVKCLASCNSYEEFQGMAGAWLNLSLDAGSDAAAREMEKRLGIPWLPMHGTFLPDEVALQYETLFARFGKTVDTASMREKALRQADWIVELLRGHDVAVDGRNMTNPYSLARVLLERGIEVRQILRSRFTGAEPEHEAWVRDKSPDTQILEIQPENGMRAQPPEPELPVSGFEMGFTRLFTGLAQLEKQAREAVQ